MNSEISKSKLYAEHTLSYVFNKLRKHDKVIEILHELGGAGWRKMKYPRGLFDRSVGLLSSNEVNEEFIALIEPFHCKVITCSTNLFESCSGKYKMYSASCEELFENCDVIIIQGDANDFKEKITASLIDKIKDEALLVVVSDDVAIDESALVNTLKSGRINALLSDKLSFAKDVADADGVMLARM